MAKVERDGSLQAAQAIGEMLLFYFSFIYNLKIGSIYFGG